MRKNRVIIRAAVAVMAAVLAILPLAACTVTGRGDTTTGAPVISTPKSKRIAFTFDDGPTPGVTDKILSKLESLGGRATFFQVANRHNYVSDSTYEKIVALGCEIGSHTYSHPQNFAKLSAEATREQLTSSVEAIENELGRKIRLFRPVGGSLTGDQLALVAELGLHTVNWNIDTRDWTEQTSDVASVEDFIERTVDDIVNKAEDGDIILMHELYLSSYEIFARAADRLAALGYELVTVSEILGLTDESRPTAKIHTSGIPMIIPDAVG